MRLSTVLFPGLSVIGSLLLGLAFADAQASVSLQPLPAQPTPAESIGLPFLQEGVCNSGLLDPQNPPFIQRTGMVFGSHAEDTQYSYTVVYQLRSSSQLCGTPPPAQVRYLDIGPLPLGQHRFHVSPIVDGQARTAYELHLQVRAEPGMPAHVSGIWFSPEQGGRGVFVTRMSPTRLAVVWFTHDANGGPSWVLATGDIDSRQSQFSATAVYTEGPGLSPGPATLSERPWGELGFRYLGCDRAELSWNAVDPRIVDGSQALVRLSRPDAMPACAPEFSGRAFWQ
jgi:hypothetical protein